ncbi:MAG: RidA family protein [bacterium]|nr:RidA family protein [bacterium]
MRSLDPAVIRPPFAAYSHGVEVRARRLVVTSGQLGIGPDGTIPETAEAQARLCFENLDAILAEAGVTRQHILRLNAYVTDRAHMAGYMAARDAYLADRPDKPASTLMIVSGFSRPEFLVEVEVIAAEEDQGA